MDSELYQTRIHKFSCKPPGHDAARQRENQRRHRARVKGRISELEQLLSGTQSKLDNALEQIESLTAEVQRLQHAPGSSSTTSKETTAQQQQLFLKPETRPRLDPFERAASDDRQESTFDAFDTPPTLPTTINREASLTTPTPNPSGTPQSQNSIPQYLVESPGNSLSVSGFEDPNDDYALLPHPSPGESTITCREAYSIIKDRSPPEFNLSTAAEWLLPGFRCATIPGTGCRVQTHILFAFVDHITPM